ncbi:MAG: M6 family metalloprotease domain-containing protein [Candidatus Cloacimonetes bacterium]|nr:M6 family metalloprotease domain-containing protein [Candidatus Cloacimonadota bacterium]
MRYIGLLCLLIEVFSFLSADYLENISQTVTDPDGAVHHLLASGDEFFNRLHDNEGYSILKHSINGYYYYAIRQGELIVPSDYRVANTNPSATNLEPGVAISHETYQARRQEFEAMYPEPSRYPAVGFMNNLVIFIRFSDQTEFPQPRTHYDTSFNDDSANANSVYSYYREVSYQTLSIWSHYYPVAPMTTNLSYQDSHPRSYYMPQSASNPDGYIVSQQAAREHQLLVNAIQFVEDSIPDTMNLDFNNDFKVDNIAFIIRGGVTAWATLLWPHRWSLFSYNEYINGLEVEDYTFQLESQSGAGTLIHEMYHVIGAPDLYHYSQDGSPTPVGPWDIMESGNGHMLTYMKSLHGQWISNIPTITQSGIYWLQPILNPVNNAYRIASPNSSNEYFVVEYRKRVAGTYEWNLPNEGMIIYRINNNFIGQGNASGPPDEIYVYRQGGSPTQTGNLNRANFSVEAGRTEFDDTSDPWDYLTWGAPGGIDIHQIGSAGDSISFILYPQLGFISGDITSDNPDIDFSEATVTIGTMSFSPTSAGHFEVAADEGTYQMQVELESHITATQVVTIPPEDYTYETINLVFLEPPTDLISQYNESSGIISLSWNYEGSNNDFQTFNVFRAIDGNQFFQVQSTTEQTYETPTIPLHIYEFYVIADYSEGESMATNTVTINLVDNDDTTSPNRVTALKGNYPNPFNPETTIDYYLAEPAVTEITIFNIKGRIVSHFRQRNLAGRHQVVWTGKNKSGDPVSSGIYYYQLKTDGKVVRTNKMILLK